MRVALFSAVAFALLSASPAAGAAPCREKGKFVKCPVVKKTVVVRCRAKGKFAKCGTPGAKPV